MEDEGFWAALNDYLQVIFGFVFIGLACIVIAGIMTGCAARKPTQS